jgi:tetratricopeptide (TPR) repeat protein
MKVSRISAITIIILFLIVGICSCQSTEENHYEGVQPDSEARFEEEYIEQIKQLVNGSEYSDKVTEDFVQMVSGWRDAQGKSVLTSWKQRLNQTEDEYKQGKISKEQLAKVEENITRELSQRIQKEISYNIKFFDLVDVIKHRQAQCISYSQLVYILGNSIGLSVEAIDVEEPMTGAFLPEVGHTAGIVSLTDGKMMIVDLVPGAFVSKPFIIEKEFVKVGNYWELKGRDNPLGIHRRIQIFDKNGLIAAIYNNRGNAYYNLGQYSQAISDYTRAIELNPEYAKAYCHRGVVYRKLGNLDQAISEYIKAIELNPKYAAAYNNRGNAYSDLGQYPKAICNFTRAIELNPKYAAAYYSRGVAYGNLGQYNQAISDYTRAIELDAKYAMAYNNRGNAYGRLGQYLQAISDFTRAIKLNPEFALAYNNRGVAYALQKSPTAACGDFYQAGILFLKKNNTTQALICVGWMKKIDPSSPLINNLMDQINK